MSVLALAKRYRDEAGINVIPIKPDGSKAPALDSFSEFKGPTGRMGTDEEHFRWFSNDNGLAALAGFISRNLEDYDFERHRN
jgi:putative DNA primase/helicase